MQQEALIIPCLGCVLHELCVVLHEGLLALAELCQPGSSCVHSIRIPKGIVQDPEHSSEHWVIRVFIGKLQSSDVAVLHKWLQLSLCSSSNLQENITQLS